jgi:hypothetical protein
MNMLEDTHFDIAAARGFIGVSSGLGEWIDTRWQPGMDAGMDALNRRTPVRLSHQTVELPSRRWFTHGIAC